MNPSKISKGYVFSLIKLISLILFLSLYVEKLVEAAPVSREYTIKASLVSKFIDFLKWPNSQSPEIELSQYALCIIGTNKFGNLFSIAKDEGVLKKDIVVYENVSEGDLKKCDIAFITGKNDDKLQRILKILNGNPTLIIGESEGYASLGVGINFIERNNKVKFEINRMALKRQGIEISSFLLNLAIIVKDNPL